LGSFVHFATETFEAALQIVPNGAPKTLQTARFQGVFQRAAIVPEAVFVVLGQLQRGGSRL
jgi:hypothetical protein